jgi:hypothetical protein
LEASQARYAELGEAAAKEAEVIKGAEEDIRTEHAAVVAELKSKHTEEVEALQSKLKEAEDLHEVCWLVPI